MARKDKQAKNVKMAKCPKCKSENITYYKFMGGECLKCNDCKYDGGEDLELYPEERGSQKAKGGFSPYKTGGGRRSVK